MDGTLAVSLINDFNPAAGSSFNLFDWSGVVGTFDLLQLPVLAGRSWDTSQLYTIGALTVVGAPTFGADGDDLHQWRGDFGANGLSDADNDGDSDGGDFLAWQRQFGGGAPTISASDAVPEPAALALASLATYGLALVHQRRR